MPRGLPPAVTDKIRRDITTALATPEVREKFASFGYEPFPVSREEFARFLVSEQKRFSDVIRNARITLD